MGGPDTRRQDAVRGRGVQGAQEREDEAERMEEDGHQGNPGRPRKDLLG